MTMVPGAESDGERFTRRTFLKVGAAGLAVAPLAACTPDDGLSSRAHRPALTTPAGEEDAAWAAVRAQFILEPGTAYMNNASLGMPPAVVSEAVGAGYDAMSREPLHGKHDLQDKISNEVLPGLASFLGVASDELAITRNATEALHIGAVGVDLGPEDEVLITTQEHPAGRRPWQYRAERHGVRVREVFIPSPFDSGDQVVALVEQALTPRTRAIAFCHVTRGGHLYPVGKLAAMAREQGILSFVDGAQALGMFPIDLTELGCDTYAASLHKWVLGPSSTGVFYVRADARDRVRSVFAHDATLAEPAFAPPGTADLPVRAAIATALEFVGTLGLEAVGKRTRYLSDYLKERLATISGVRLLSGATPETCCPGSTIFEMDGVDAVEAVDLIAEAVRTHVDEHQRDGHNAIRISTHIYNTRSEIDRLIEGLEGLRG